MYHRGDQVTPSRHEVDSAHVLRCNEGRPITVLMTMVGIHIVQGVSPDEPSCSTTCTAPLRLVSHEHRDEFERVVMAERSPDDGIVGCPEEVHLFLRETSAVDDGICTVITTLRPVFAVLTHARIEQLEHLGTATSALHDRRTSDIFIVSWRVPFCTRFSESPSLAFDVHE